MHCMLYVSAAHVIENGVIVKGNSTGCSDLGNKFHKIAAFCSVCVCVCLFQEMVYSVSTCNGAGHYN